MTQQYPRRKLIIDADAGIDDAMALVLALDSHKRGEVDIRAITCVNGNTTVKNSQVNVLRILDVMGCPKGCQSLKEFLPTQIKVLFFYTKMGSNA